MKLFKIIITIAVQIFFINISFADSPILFSDTTSGITIGNKISVLEDKSNTFTFQDIQTSDKFIPNKQSVLNLGISSSSFWLKFQIKNTSDKKHLLLELAYPILEDVEFYSITSDNKFSVEKMGNHQAFSKRKYSHQHFLFDLNIQKDSTCNYFIKIKSKEQILLPLSIGTTTFFLESLLREDTIFGIYFGIILIMFCYNLFIYFIVKDKAYLYYVLYIISIGIAQASLGGYTFKYLLPDSPVLANHTIIIFAALAGIFAVEFLRLFLQTKKYIPKLNKLFPVFNSIYILAIVFSILGFDNIGYRIVDINGLPLSLFILYVTVVILNKGNRSAKFFIFAWSVFLIGVTLFALRNLGILPFNIFTNYTILAGSAIEATLLSFALADRINILKKEKEESQAQVVLALQENSRIVTEQNILLEAKVKERTSELEITNNNLKDTQSQLVNAEKMASLGQLTAGIAHEINNPINFVISNIKPLKNDVADIFSLLTMYGDIKNAEQLTEKLKEINDFKEKNETNYLFTEINSLLKGIDEGAYRTAEIVKGLKIFAHLDETDLKESNIIEGLDSTLAMLNSNIKSGKIKVIKEYDKQFPKIECLAGQLNQVFMNILNNAIQAMNGTLDAQKEKILTIKAYAENNNAIIKIKDNGPGISEKIKSKIFDPFFTTKAVGSGTGLGLSIAYKIIKEHKGEITVESEEGKGSEFIISLPISRN